MDAQEAIRQAEAHLRNAEDQLKVPVGQKDMFLGADDQVTAVDNLTTALDNFLADTESIPDPKLKELRGRIRDAKRKLTDAVVAYEAQKEGAQMEGGEPSPEEWVEVYLESADDMLGLVQDALKEKVKDVHELGALEEPLAVVNGYLADSEPFQETSRELQKARSKVRMARKDLKSRIDAVLQDWKAKDRASGADGDDEDED